MTKKIVFGVALALVIAVIAAPTASAACNPPKALSTYNAGSGAFIFWTTSLNAVSAIGKVWNATTDFTGNCNDGNQTFLYFNSPNEIGMNLSLGEGCVPGTSCPSGTVNVTITATDANGNQEFLSSQTVENPPGSFYFATLPHAMVPAAKTTVLGSSRNANLRSLQVTIPAVGAGAFEGTAASITGYNVRSAQQATDPGRFASGFPSLDAFIPAAGGAAASATVNVDCTNPAPRWVVTQLVDSSGGNTAVSKATKVNCDPLMADPKYKIVPKKSMGTGTSH